MSVCVYVQLQVYICVCVCIMYTDTVYRLLLIYIYIYMYYCLCILIANRTVEHLSQNKLLFLLTVGCKIPRKENSPIFFCFFWYNLHNIQLTPQKLSAWRKNHPGAPGAGVWPEDQKRHRGRRKTRPPPVSRGSSP